MKASASPPPFVVFEGADGAGKTSISRALAAYYRAMLRDRAVLLATFPGRVPGTLGELVNKLHHRNASPPLAGISISPPALQLLHVAAHVDAILTSIGPVLLSGGCVILDRYWWSTYAYARLALPQSLAWSLVAPERAFWAQLPAPEIVYLRRRATLKPEEVEQEVHSDVQGHYRELLRIEQAKGVSVHVISNEGPPERTWSKVLRSLGLPNRDYRDFAP